MSGLENMLLVCFIEVLVHLASKYVYKVEIVEKCRKMYNCIVYSVHCVHPKHICDATNCYSASKPPEREKMPPRQKPVCNQKT